MNNFVRAVNSGASNAVNATSRMGSNMVNAVSRYRGSFQSAGRNLMYGLQAGINSGSSGVINSAINVMNRAVNAAKRAAAIHSPSRVWRDDIGKMLPAGMAKGIDAMSYKAVEATAEMMNSVGDEAKRSVDVEVNGNTKTTGRRISRTSKDVSDAFSLSLIHI